jgi:putative FmdB family regulatory protein
MYEYRCPHCEIKFSKLRPYVQADAPATCPECRGEDTKRVLSMFASFSRSSDGSSHAVAGSGGCAGCASGSCAGCGHSH